MNANNYFSVDYPQARQHFLAAATAADATLDCLELDGQALQGETLAIDIAWLGSLKPRQVLLHISGLHGVEGFAGSAIQLQVLAEPPVLAADAALILVHALNPYGMACWRRVNESNVDLNRNFPGSGQRWAGASQAYRAMDKLLNPHSPPAWDGFLAQVLVQILRHGLPALKQAVAAGQYDYPKGLFYGGTALQQGPRRFLKWLAEQLVHAEYVLAIDVHTGLGPWAREALFMEIPPETGLGLRTLMNLRPFTKLPYIIQGGLGAALPATLPGVRVEALTQEFGTYPVLQVLHALREENRWHHYGGGALNHPSKRRLRKIFYPPSAAWRAAILEQGVGLLKQAAGVLSPKS